MNWGDVFEAIYLCNADTIMAAAFRKAAGIASQAPRGKTGARVDRYAGARRLMAQRHGVRL